MNPLAAILIVCGYLAVIWLGGWIGLAAVAAHIGIMVWATGRR
jgi:hypothetical protein